MPISEKKLTTDEIALRPNSAGIEEFDFSPRYIYNTRYSKPRVPAKHVAAREQSLYQMFMTWKRDFPFESGQQRTFKVSLKITLKPNWTWKDDNGQNTTNKPKELVILIKESSRETILLKVQHVTRLQQMP